MNDMIHWKPGCDVPFSSPYSCSVELFLPDLTFDVISLLKEGYALIDRNSIWILLCKYVMVSISTAAGAELIRFTSQEKNGNSTSE